MHIANIRISAASVTFYFNLTQNIKFYKALTKIYRWWPFLFLYYDFLISHPLAFGSFIHPGKLPLNPQKPHQLRSPQSFAFCEIVSEGIWPEGWVGSPCCLESAVVFRSGYPDLTLTWLAHTWNENNWYHGFFNKLADIRCLRVVPADFWINAWRKGIHQVQFVFIQKWFVSYYRKRGPAGRGQSVLSKRFPGIHFFCISWWRVLLAGVLKQHIFHGSTVATISR